MEKKSKETTNATIFDKQTIISNQFSVCFCKYKRSQFRTVVSQQAPKYPKRVHNAVRDASRMRAWLATAGSGDSAKTRPPAAAREEDISLQAKDAANCYFTDLWKLGGDRKRGAPPLDFKQRERARQVLVAAYVASYVVTTRPIAAEGEKTKAVQQGVHRQRNGGIQVLGKLNFFVCPTSGRRE